MAFVTDDPKKRWPRGEIPWSLGSGISAAREARIRSALNLLTTRTAGGARLRFPERTTQGDYIRFVLDNGSVCSSKRGYKGGRQDIKCSFNSRRTIIHEILHALGFVHEHQRPDRGAWVNYDKDERVAALKRGEHGKKSQYTVIDDERPVGPYDIRSVMHYTDRSFMWKKERATRSDLSAGDLAALNRFYSKENEIYHAVERSNGNVMLWRTDHGLPMLHDGFDHVLDLPSFRLSNFRSPSQVEGFSGLVAYRRDPTSATVRVLFRDSQGRGDLPHFERWHRDQAINTVLNGSEWDRIATARVGSGMGAVLGYVPHRQVVEFMLLDRRGIATRFPAGLGASSTFARSFAVPSDTYSEMLVVPIQGRETLILYDPRRMRADMYGITAAGVDLASHVVSSGWRSDWSSIDVVSGGTRARLVFARRDGGLALYLLAADGSWTRQGPAQPDRSPVNLQLPDSGPLRMVRTVRIEYSAGGLHRGLATIRSDTHELQFHRNLYSVISRWGSPIPTRAGLRNLVTNQRRRRGRELLFSW